MLRGPPISRSPNTLNPIYSNSTHLYNQNIKPNTQEDNIMCPSGRNLRLQSPTSDFRPAFDVLDTDSDGKISREDLRSFYATNSGSVKDDAIGAMISVADTNMSGFVEYEEFERVVNGDGEKRPLVCGAMEDVFKVMDRDGDGKVGHQDLKNYMALAGFAATDEDISVMIRFGGGDLNGGVSLDGLIRILAFDHLAPDN